ncbi:MAG: reverse transcriptase domain-containing protein [Candidatus Arsenophonus phytopathogenicus]
MNKYYYYYLRFADEIVLVASSEEELGKMLKQLDEVSTEVKLKINRAKTKIRTKPEDERGTYSVTLGDVQSDGVSH